ncbi:MAG: hypothetical protein MR912_11555 [Prevotella sp.]|nr:hypothetical protein [Prevotella sp.]
MKTDKWHIYAIICFTSIDFSVLPMLQGIGKRCIDKWKYDFAGDYL